MLNGFTAPRIPRQSGNNVAVYGFSGSKNIETRRTHEGFFKKNKQTIVIPRESGESIQNGGLSMDPPVKPGDDNFVSFYKNSFARLRILRVSKPLQFIVCRI
jgi:hypothetical protein